QASPYRASQEVPRLLQKCAADGTALRQAAEARICCEPLGSQENSYSRAGLSTRIFLRTAASGAQVGRRLSTSPSSTGHSGVTFEVLPFSELGCGQLVPHRMRSTLASISIWASGVK